MAARPRCYAGIGSRQTPQDVLDLIVAAAKHFAAQRLVLRSGHAPGADQAFERGAAHRAEVFLPWPDFEASTPVKARTIVTSPTREALSLSASHHPAWDGLSRGACQLHGRNAHQVLGLHLDDPAEFVLCWTPDGSVDGMGSDTGGTGQALRIAAAHGVPVFNLQRPNHRARIGAMVNQPKGTNA